jgi:hypothetical protein
LLTTRMRPLLEVVASGLVLLMTLSAYRAAVSERLHARYVCIAEMKNASNLQGRLGPPSSNSSA